MCGITGFVNAAPSPEVPRAGCADNAVLERISRVIAHRWLDDPAVCQDSWAWLGHRRLSIIDVGGGWQPMTNEEQSLWIPYNGEVFNHASLRPEMERAGHCYATRCDTEMFANIRKLMPGHHLFRDLGRGQPESRIEQYWDVPAPAMGAGRDDAAWIAECRSRLEETVRMRLMSDVPLGMFLSGGVDSSAIAALIQRMVSRPVKTFAVGYREARFSELSYAAEVARSLGTEHREVRVGMEDSFQSLPQLVWQEDEPICWPSSVSLYFVSKLAAEHVKVVLTGEGSDELFGGYERYAWNLLNQRALSVYGWVPSWLRSGLRRTLASSSLFSASLRRKLGHTFFGREETLESLYLDNFYCAFPRDQQNRLLAPPAGAVYGNFLRYWNARPDASPLARMLYADQKTYLVELLMKQDGMSMACSPESRVPFLDHPFVEFAASVPEHLKIRVGAQKYVLKKAVEDLLPRAIIHCKKMGFPTPLRQWLLDPRAGPLFASLCSADGFLASCLDLHEIQTVLDRHRAGVHDATDRIWRLLNLQLWGDIFLTGKRDRWSLSPLHVAEPASAPR